MIGKRQRMKTMTTQLELPLGDEARRRHTPADRRRARAAWWFAQMRRVVDAAGEPVRSWSLSPVVGAPAPSGVPR